MSNNYTVNLNEVSSGGASVFAGHWPGRLLTCEGAISKTKADGKGGNPMIVATFVITEGTYEGLEAKIWYPLAVTETRGKRYAGGVLDCKKSFAAVGKPLPDNFAFPAVPANDPSVSAADKQRVADLAAQLYGKRMKGLDVELLVTNEAPRLDDKGEQKVDSEGNKLFNTRTQVIGLWSPAKASSKVADTVSGTNSDFDEFDD